MIFTVSPLSIHLLSSVSPPIRTSLALLISEVSILSLASLSELSFSLAPVSRTEFAENENKLISNYLNLNEINTDHYLLENVFLLLWHFQLFLYCYWQLKISIKIMHFEGDIGWSWPCEIWLRTSDSQLSVNLDSFSLKRKVFSLYS